MFLGLMSTVGRRARLLGAHVQLVWSTLLFHWLVVKNNRRWWELSYRIPRQMYRDIHLVVRGEWIPLWAQVAVAFAVAKQLGDIRPLDDQLSKPEAG